MNKKIIATFVALSIIFAALSSLITAYVLTLKYSTERVTPNDVIITDGESHGLKLMRETIDPADYAANGISGEAIWAGTIEAIVEPEDAVNKKVTFSAEWNIASSEWASGKDVADYLTVTQDSDGALTATIECLQAFGEQIILTVASQYNERLTATANIDFVKRIENITLSPLAGTLEGDYYSGYTFGEQGFVKVDATFGVGTLEGSFKYGKLGAYISKTSIFEEYFTTAVGEYFYVTNTNPYIIHDNELLNPHDYLAGQYISIQSFKCFIKDDYFDRFYEDDCTTPTLAGRNYENILYEYSDSYLNRNAPSFFSICLEYTYTYGDTTYNKGILEAPFKFNSSGIGTAVDSVTFANSSYII